MLGHPSNGSESTWRGRKRLHFSAFVQAFYPQPSVPLPSSLLIHRTRCFSCGATCDGTSPGEESLDSTKLFLGALPKDTPQETLKEYFSQFGPVADAFCMKARNFGFVRFETEEGAQLVMASGPHIIGGKELDIKQITVPDPKSQPGAPRASGKGKGKAGESGKGKGKGKGDPYDSRKRTAGQIDNVPMTAGDWRCNACGNLNFARRTGK